MYTIELTEIDARSLESIYRLALSAQRPLTEPQYSTLFTLLERLCRLGYQTEFDRACSEHLEERN